MPLTTAEIYAKIGIEEGQRLHLLALICDDCGSLEGYGATHPDWVDGEFVATEYGRVLYVFNSAEKAAEFVKKTRGPDSDPAYPNVVFAWSDWGADPCMGLSHFEPREVSLRYVAYVVAYFSHTHTLAVDAGPHGEGRYIPLAM